MSLLPSIPSDLYHLLQSHCSDVAVAEQLTGRQADIQAQHDSKHLTALKHWKTKEQQDQTNGRQQNESTDKTNEEEDDDDNGELDLDLDDEGFD